MPAYYNEHDPFAAAWLRNLIGDGLIAPGDVDERDIQLVQPCDLAGYDQCHFFAGIGGWSLALRLAGWPDDRPVWTGSCPCQPFSSAGKGEGFGDPRHLWPTWFRLIRECSPPVVFGEQVASPDGLGWLDHVSTDLEAVGYAFGAADLPAASVKAPHGRQRLFFVGHSGSARLGSPAGTGEVGPVAHHHSERLNGEPVRLFGRGPQQASPEASGGGTHSGWRDARWIPCSDGYLRAVPPEPSLFPVAHARAFRNRVGALRGAGNAIVPQVGSAFIEAFMSVLGIK